MFLRLRFKLFISVYIPFKQCLETISFWYRSGSVKPESGSLKPGSGSLKPGSWSLKHGFRLLKPGYGSGSLKPGSGSLKIKVSESRWFFMLKLDKPFRNKNIFNNLSFFNSSDLGVEIESYCLIFSSLDADMWISIFCGSRKPTCFGSNESEF